MERIVVGNKTFDCPEKRAAKTTDCVNGREQIKISLLGNYGEVKAAFSEGASYAHEWSGRDGASYSEDLSAYSIPVEIADCLDGSFFVTMCMPSAEDRLSEIEASLRMGVNACHEAAVEVGDTLNQAAYEHGRREALALCEAAPELSGTEIIRKEEFVPVWGEGPQVPGAVVQWQGQVYRVLQGHDSTGNPGWSPDAARALFSLCHTTDPDRAKPWVAPLGTSGLYYPGECYRDEKGAIWRQVFAGGNEYDAATVPARWERVD